jgi:flavin-dependent dehydrogenase
MKKEVFDVIIVGAGPAGLMLAKKLDNSGLRVLLIEKRKTIKKLDYGIFMTFCDTVKKFKIGHAVINQFQNFAVYGPQESAKVCLNKKAFALVDLNRWAEKIRLKCDARTNTQIVSARKNKKGITLTDAKNNRYFGKLVADCSGNSQIVAASLGIKKSTIYFRCHTFLLENCSIPDHKEPSLSADLKFTNGAGWLYPFSSTKCQFGLADFLPCKSKFKKNLRKRAVMMAKYFKPYSGWFKNSKIASEFYKDAPVIQPHSSMISDNFISVGDAGGQSAPFLGEGIRTAFEMAVVASEVIKKAFVKGDFSNKTLGEFQKKWREKFGKKYAFSILLRKLWTDEFSNEDIDYLINNLKKLSKKDFYKILKSDLNLKLFMKMLDFKIAKDVMHNFFRKLP